MKHAEKVIKNAMTVKPDKPILKGVKHFEDGSMAVTDAHRLYLAKDMHDKREMVLTPAGKELEGNYPEIARLLPSNDPECSLTFEVDELIKSVDIILTAAKASDDDVPVMSYAENILFYESTEMTASYELPQSIEIYLASNAQYWIEALRLFKALKYREITMNIYGKLRPFTFVSADEKVTALILPVKTGRS